MNHHPYSLTLYAKQTARTSEAELEHGRQLAIARDARRQQRTTDHGLSSPTPVTRSRSSRSCARPG